MSALPPTYRRCNETRAHYAHEWYAGPGLTPTRMYCPGGPDEFTFASSRFTEVPIDPRAVDAFDAEVYSGLPEDPDAAAKVRASVAAGLAAAARVTKMSATEPADSPASPETPKVAQAERADTAAAAVGSDDATATTRQGETPATPLPAGVGSSVDGTKIYLRALGEVTTDDRVLATIAALRGELLDENTRRAVAHILRKVAGRKHRRPRTSKALHTLADTLELGFNREAEDTPSLDDVDEFTGYGFQHECEPVYDRTIYECGHAHGYCRVCGKTTEVCIDATRSGGQVGTMTDPYRGGAR